MSFTAIYNHLIAHEYEGGLDHGRKGLMPLHEYVVQSPRFQPEESHPRLPYWAKIGAPIDLTPVRDYTEGYILGLTEFIKEHIPLFLVPRLPVNAVFADLESNLIYVVGMRATKPSKVRELAPETPLSEEKYGFAYRLGVAVSFVRTGNAPRVALLDVIPLEDSGWNVLNKDPKKFGKRIAGL